ncbi:uncharacterized protein LOC129755528 [Uranotaenia lowii]|uniref:uncharacterized protein LOC129755528 n=1 Tax=Uranotaenia lowii TaxID=190385 RepID=UPI0024795C81|nr:uncharacterized protein LOC129755528 [Uranotaenia lowii]XP_055608040.1 uncharacterized protein LOC129755528 [Uranotaenia lowii]XP_055608041.1 uncharacterized protein LOC129755528 [Uranotaenia lowii]XP_055608042.1 uncharacterized protein LOC129755528 [Uranotaenia lowii]XP_055608044.1 uncharacterized protein LOC129755528 [Uranotaenia lowii]XP_055608045.1 uncharacterized protein LOC129755528 [Uranotaenia lowii]
MSPRVLLLALALFLVPILGTVAGSRSLNATTNSGKVHHRQQLRNETCPGKFCNVADRATETDRLIVGSNRALRQQEILRHTSVVYGLISMAEPEELSQRCYDQMQQIYEGIQQKEIWAMKILDASGTPEPGFMWGHNHWIGSEKGCESARSPLSITRSDRYQRHMNPNLIAALAPFEVDFRIVHARHQSAWQVEMKFMSENILHIGLCVPRSCSNGELHNLTARYFDEGVIQAQDIFEFKPDVLQVKDMQLPDHFWTKPSVFIIGISFIVTGLMVLLAYNRDQKELEYERSCKNLNCPKQPTTTNGVNPGTYSLAPKHTEATTANGAVAPNDDERMKETPANTPASAPVTKNGAAPRPTSFAAKVIDSFNVRKNLIAVFETDIGPQSLPVICGIKSICCFLILCFHMQWYTFFTINNSGVMFHYAEQIRYQLVTNAPLLVDGFFAISGFLVTYNFIRNRGKLDEIRANGIWANAKMYWKMVLHRYLR